MIPSAQAFSRGKRWRSKRWTSGPARPSRIAVAEPAGPAPATATSIMAGGSEGEEAWLAAHPGPVAGVGQQHRLLRTDPVPEHPDVGGRAGHRRDVGAVDQREGGELDEDGDVVGVA